MKPILEYLEVLITLKTRISANETDYHKRIDERIEKICEMIDKSYGIE